MPHRRVITTVLVAGAIVGLSAFAFGGWATITLDDLPETVVASQPVTLSFVVKQHGLTPLGRLTPSVTATDGKTTVDATVSAGATGRYSSRLVLPRAGEWSITVQSGFMNAQVKLPPVRALSPSSPAPAPRTLAERGERLFVAKACVTCHVHRAVAGLGNTSIEVGPELTPKRYDAEYLERFLIDPSIARSPGRPDMPRPVLSPAELTALVAFINHDRSPAARR